MHNEEDFTNPPGRRLGALAIIRDDEGSVLLVQKAYKTTGNPWGLPGGLAQANEAPHAAWTRLVKWELGLDRLPGQFLAVDYVGPSEASGSAEGINFVFDGGTATLEDIQLPEIRDGEPAELTAFQFCPVHALSEFVTPLTEQRIRSALADRDDGRGAQYLTEGRLITEG